MKDQRIRTWKLGLESYELHENEIENYMADQIIDKKNRLFLSGQ
jgi:hypothetical protein